MEKYTIGSIVVVSSRTCGGGSLSTDTENVERRFETAWTMLLPCELSCGKWYGKGSSSSSLNVACRFMLLWAGDVSGPTGAAAAPSAAAWPSPPP